MYRSVTLKNLYRQILGTSTGYFPEQCSACTMPTGSV